MKKWLCSVLKSSLYITLLCTSAATLLAIKESSFIAGTMENMALEGYTVAVVGKEFITHEDVCARLAMQEVLFHRGSGHHYVKLYQQAANDLVNEARQRQAPARLVYMAKKFLQTQAVAPLIPAEIQKEVQERMANMAKNSGMTLEGFKKHLDVHYETFYKRQEAMVAFQRYLMVKWGSRAMRNISLSAIAKERKKWKSMQNAPQYRTSEIVVYNRSGQGLEYDRIKEVHSLLNNGEPFSDLATRFSDAHTRDSGGDCGWRVLGQFDRPIQEFLRNAAGGDISPIIALPTGKNPQKWVLVLIMDYRNPEQSADAGKKEKDPGDEAFRHMIFAKELDRISREEMEDLRKSFPAPLNIPPKVMMQKIGSPASHPTATRGAP